MTPKTLQFSPVGDSGLLVTLDDHISEDVNRQLIRLWQAALAAAIPGVLDYTPAFTSILVHLDPVQTDHATVRAALEAVHRLGATSAVQTGRTVEIPVCYGGAFGEDLPFVAEHTGLAQQEVIALHSSQTYLIYMIGFLPGFPYLGGMDERLFTPRLKTPRTKIPAGSVGIGGEQTGVYPLESPGGWQLIGRTPLTLFDPAAEQPRYQAGDRIRFIPISPEEFTRLSPPQGVR